MRTLPISISLLAETQDSIRLALYRAYNDLLRQARDSEDPDLHLLVGEAYAAFMRAHLTDVERDLLEAQAEVTRLRAENARLRSLRGTLGGAL
jgi:hypothetical protein